MVLGSVLERQLFALGVEEPAPAVFFIGPLRDPKLIQRTNRRCCRVVWKSRHTLPSSLAKPTLRPAELSIELRAFRDVGRREFDRISAIVRLQSLEFAPSWH